MVLYKIITVSVNGYVQNNYSTAVNGYVQNNYSICC